MDNRFYDDQFKMSLLDVDKFIKVNNVQEISNPTLFNKDNTPTSSGLLSNEIFGITSATRSSTFGYIDLEKYFLQPIIYKIWSKIDSNIYKIVHGTELFSIKDGNFVQDKNGKTGIDFLIKNIDKINFKKGTESVRRDRNIKFLETNRNNFFIDKYIVIPPMYRDVQTNTRKLSVGDINKLYINLLLLRNALRDSKMYGFLLSESVRGKVQDLLLEIYNWFGSGTESNPNGGIPHKYGILKQTNLKKTTDYGTRLVMTAPDLNVESMDDLQVDLDHSLVPMASIAVNFFPFMIFNMRRFFENCLTGLTTIQDVNSNSYKLGDWRNEFSDEKLKQEIDRFIHGYSDRFRPIMIPVIKNNKKLYKEFYIKKFFELDLNGTKGELNRAITWCDLIFISAVESVKNKTIFFTRYPIDTYFNQFPSFVNVSSTIETEQMTVLGQYYKHYPKIRKEDLRTNTSSKFLDSINICNCYLGSISGDYDGDMGTIKGVFTDEANEEVERQIHSNRHYINLGCEPEIECTKEAIQSLFALTLTFDETPLTSPKF